MLTKVYKGNFLSVNETNDVYTFLVVENNRIKFIGNDLPIEYSNLNIIDLGNGCVVPTFVDTHQHFASFSIFNAGLNVMDLKSNEEIKEAIRNFIKTSKDKLIIGFGASPYSVKEGVLISKTELDEVCPDKPIVMVKYDGHACICNSKLIEKLNKKIKDLRGYHFDTGEMNQEAFFKVSDYITNSVSIPKLIRNMNGAVNFQISNGIGMVHTVSGVGFPLNMDISLEKLFAKSLKNGFQIRVFPQSLNTKVATKRHLKRIGGCFECALDGCFGSQDASLLEPYENNKSNSGVLYYSDEKVIEFCKKANRKGLQIELHAIGDKAFNQACLAIKAALDDYPRKDHRHGIIHDCLPTPEGIEICKKYGIQMPVQSSFIGWAQEPDDYLVSILGKERWNKLNPLKTFKDNNIMVSFGSDAPCTTPSPIMWIDKAVNNVNENERLDVKDALRMCTINGAKATFDESDYGSLEVGKLSNFVVLDKNLYEVNSKEINDINVIGTYFGGEIARKQKGGLFKMLFKGTFSRGKF